MGELSPRGWTKMHFLIDQYTWASISRRNGTFGDKLPPPIFSSKENEEAFLDEVVGALFPLLSSARTGTRFKSPTHQK